MRNTRIQHALTAARTGFMPKDHPGFTTPPATVVQFCHGVVRIVNGRPRFSVHLNQGNNVCYIRCASEFDAENLLNILDRAYFPIQDTIFQEDL